jgi:hypothetical protein
MLKIKTIYKASPPQRKASDAGWPENQAQGALPTPNRPKIAVRELYIMF